MVYLASVSLDVVSLSEDQRTTAVHLWDHGRAKD